MMKKTMALLFWVMLAALPLSAQDATDEPEPLEAGPDTITIATEGLMPEGIDYDPITDTFLVGSLSRGGIWRIALDGTIEPFIEDENLTSTVGIHVVAYDGVVFAANNAPDNSTAGLGAYLLETGELITYFDFATLYESAGGYFANDITMDVDYNVYVTDSYAGLIVRANPEGESDVFLEDDSFAGQFTLNGIEYHPDGYLLAVRGDGLIKIPLADPTAFTEVETEVVLRGADGLYWLPATEEGATGTLVVVSNATSKVMQLTSDDDWATATLVSEYQSAKTGPTTATARGSEVYVTYPLFNNPNADEYTLIKAVFEPAE